MTAIVLCTLWLNSADDPTDVMAFPYLSSLASTPQQNVQLQPFAQGRIRAIITPGTAQQVAVDLAACSGDQRAWLDDHAAALLCVRDDRGRKFYGMYVAPATAEHQYNSDSEVSVTINEVTFSEAV